MNKDYYTDNLRLPKEYIVLAMYSLKQKMLQLLSARKVRVPVLYIGQYEVSG